MYMMIQDRETVKKLELFTSIASKAILLLRYMYMRLVYQEVYILQILHTASLVAQDQEKINVMGVQLMYITILRQKTVEFLPKCYVASKSMALLFDFFFIKGCTNSRFCTQLA